MFLLSLEQNCQPMSSSSEFQGDCFAVFLNATTVTLCVEFCVLSHVLRVYD